MIKRGMTLIELIVAVTLFVTVLTLSLGGFVTITRTKTLLSSLKETQQKVRLITEMTTRFGKEASAVKTSNTTTREELAFTFSDTTTKFFVLTKVLASDPYYNSFIYYSCPAGVTSPTAACEQENLLSSPRTMNYGIQQVSGLVFQRTKTIPPTLRFSMNLRNISSNRSANGAYYDDNVTIDTLIIMENVR